jgi:Arc/MetJ-type ribon-helix-helix transcriptional regulator
MTITLRPEHEQAIKEAIRSGAYRNPDEVIDRTLQLLRAKDDWLFENRDALNAKIDRANAQIDRGEGILGDELRTRLEIRKVAWLAGQNVSESTAQ